MGRVLEKDSTFAAVSPESALSAISCVEGVFLEESLPERVSEETFSFSSLADCGAASYSPNARYGGKLGVCASSPREPSAQPSRRASLPHHFPLGESFVFGAVG